MTIEINKTQENAMNGAVATSLVKRGWDARQAMAIGATFTSSIADWEFGSELFAETFEIAIQNVIVDKQHIFKDASDVDFDNIIISLVDAGFIAFFLDTEVMTMGDATDRILDLDMRGYAPALAVDGVNRRRNWTKTGHTSGLMKEAIEALESTEFEASSSMLSIARKVWNIAGAEDKVILDRNMYVLKGTAAMEAGEAHVSEFFGDARGRLYQAACFGPNGQSSDIARAMMDLHGVSTDYNVEDATKLVIDEMMDMGSWDNVESMFKDAACAAFYQEEFIVKHLDKDAHDEYITKPWNFTKFAMILNGLQAGSRPYIGIAVGLDAKCSGPQLGALMVNDARMLAATGFSQVQLDDAYHNAIVECEKVGIMNMTRSLVKKPFMAVFYGAGKDAMSDAETITQHTWNALYEGIVGNSEAMESTCEMFYKAINASFGRALNTVRASVKAAGYDYEAKVCKYDSVPHYEMPDGLRVEMNYKFKVDVDGLQVDRDTLPSVVTVVDGFNTKVFKNATFTTDEFDYASFARTGFVNMIQATDALLARLIVVHLNRMGAQHIIAVHDCFRVNINDMAILNEAIKQAYLDLFSSMKDEATADLPNGTDILKAYFKGSMEATKTEFKAEAHLHSQFAITGTRLLRHVNGVRIATLINDLGTTYYFAK